MGHSKIGLATLALLLTTGCASVQWVFQKMVRTPGERLESMPDAVWSQYDCESKSRPFFQIEQNALAPKRVRSGGDFGHRMVYVLCPRSNTEVVTGRLSTRIRFKGAPLIQDTVEGYELKPGRWVLDAFVQIPANAEPGIYAYEIVFESGDVAFDERLSFAVGVR